MKLGGELGKKKGAQRCTNGGVTLKGTHGGTETQIEGDYRGHAEQSKPIQTGTEHRGADGARQF